MIKRFRNWYNKSDKNRDAFELARAYIGATIICILCATGYVSAMYSGETFTVNSNLTQIITYQIINNNSFINVSSQTNSSLNITIDELAEPQSFSIVFQGYKTEDERVITTTVTNTVTTHSGGGYVYRDRNITKYVNVTPERIIYINNTTPLIESTPIKNKNRIYAFFILVFIIIILSVSYYIYNFIKKRNELKGGNETWTYKQQ